MAKSGQWSEDTVVPKEKITVGRIKGTWKGEGLVADRVNRIADGGRESEAKTVTFQSVT